MTNTNLLPRYRCHKEVQAAKITDVSISNSGEPVLTIEGEVLRRVTKEYIEKHDPQTGGYFVLYEDGYQSYSPAVAFESGYTSIENLNVMGRELKSAPSEIIINSKPLKYSVSAPEGTESVTLQCQQMVKLNGIPFFLMEDVQAYTGSKGNVALAFEEQSSVGVGDSVAEAECIDLEAADFSDALLWLKEGKRVSRAGWNGKGQFVTLVQPGFNDVGCSTGAKAGSLQPFLALKNAQDMFQPGWVPSMGDLMATDWQICDGVPCADERQVECGE